MGDTRLIGWPSFWLTNMPDSYIATEIPIDFVLDDMYISVMVVDLNNHFFAMAGPTQYTQNHLGTTHTVVAGRVQINRRRLGRALQANYFENLMLHEIGHAVGIGPMWRKWGLTEKDETGQETYIGKHGLEAWRKMGCSGPLPVEGLHWDEQCILHEVMNPNFYRNHRELFTSLSMGTLKDMGYQVNGTEADAMDVGDLIASACGEWCPEATGRRRLGEVPPPLSMEAELEILHAAANYFRTMPPQEDLPEEFESSIGDFLQPPQVVSIVYEENGNYHSRIVHKQDTEHL